MKVTLKFVLVLGLLITAALSIAEVLEVRRERMLFDSEMRQDHLHLAHALTKLVGHLWRPGQIERIARIVESTSDPGRRVSMRLIALPPPGGTTPLAAHDLDRLVHGRSVTLREQPAATSPGYLRTYVPIRMGSLPMAIEIVESLTQERSYIQSTVSNIVLITALLLIGCVLAAFAVGVVFIGRPTQALVAKAQRIGAGDLGRPLVLARRDEFGILAREINLMCDNLATTRQLLEAETTSRVAAMEQLRHADRLATVGKLASAIAHELGTPLNVVMARAQMIANGENEGQEARASAGIIADQVQRMARIVRQLLDFARRRPGQRKVVSLLAVAHQALSLLMPLTRKHGVTLRLGECDPSPVVLGDGEHILQALTNLVMNAIQATDQGEVVVSIRRVEVQPPVGRGGREGPHLCLEVKDTGYGMEKETGEHIFEPFFTTKTVGVGTGLGLSVVSGVVNEHGGWIDVQSEPGKGSTFSLFFPAGVETSDEPADPDRR